MSGLYPQPTYIPYRVPSFALNGGNALPTSAPTGSTTLASAHGYTEDFQRVVVEVSGATTLTIYVWSTANSVFRQWTVAASQITFAAAGMDYFDVPLGCHFYLQSSAGSITAWADCIRPQPSQTMYR